MAEVVLRSILTTEDTRSRIYVQLHCDERQAVRSQAVCAVSSALVE